MDSEAATAASFGPEYEEIDRQLAMLHLIWRTYRELFATSETQFNLLRDSLPGFSCLLHYILIDAVMLGICRLNDSAASCGNPNLTFERLRTTLTPLHQMQRNWHGLTPNYGRST